MPATIGTYTKPATTERDSEQLALVDALIEHEKTLKVDEGEKAYVEDVFKDEKAARKFQYEVQMGARQRERGFRTTVWNVVDKDGNEVPKGEDGKRDPKLVKSVTVGGTLGAFRTRNTAPESDAS